MEAPSFDNYLSVPFVMGGRDMTGLDCYGLVWLIYRDRLGIEMPRYEGVCDLWREIDQLHAMIQGQVATNDWIQIQKSDLKLWDVVFIEKLDVLHIGICIGWPKVIHMWHTGVVVDDVSRPGKGRIGGCFRHRSLPA